MALMLTDETQIKEWAASIKNYESSRKKVAWDHVERTKPVTHKEVKAKEVSYDPVLQKHTNDQAEIRATMRENERTREVLARSKEKTLKYAQEIDIITLEPNPEKPTTVQIEKTRAKLKPTAQVDYNIISNNELEDYYYSKNWKRSEKKVKEKVSQRPKRDFNIISNRYVEAHEDKVERDSGQVRDELEKKFWKTHDYNALTAKYYDDGKEKEFQEHRKVEQADHMKKAIAKLPPSWKYRESLILDRTKEIPEEIKAIDKQRKNAKRRFELRYKIEEEYKERDVDDQLKKEVTVRNKLHDYNSLEDVKRGFDIINLGPSDQKRLEITKKPSVTTWDRISRTANLPPATADGTSNQFFRETRQTESAALPEMSSTGFPRLTGPRFRSRQPPGTTTSTTSNAATEPPEMELGKTFNHLKLLSNDKKGPLFGATTNHLLRDKEMAALNNTEYTSNNDTFSASTRQRSLDQRPKWNASTGGKITRTQTGGFYGSNADG